MPIIRQLWQHKRTGEVYAVEVDGATVTGACGPLDYIEQRADMLDQMPYDPELGRELDAAQADYVLTRQPPEKRTTMRWTWKELQRWLIHNRPEIGITSIDGVKGFYRRDVGPAESFIPCGFTWRDVARRLQASASDE